MLRKFVKTDTVFAICTLKYFKLMFQETNAVGLILEDIFLNHLQFNK